MYVAIKYIKKKALSKKELVMYKQEIETLLNLDHKNVIDLFAYLEVDTYLYIMMNYMKNGTLFDFLQMREFTVSEAQARSIMV